MAGPPPLHRVDNAEPALAASLPAFVLDVDCARRLRAEGDSSDGGDAGPKSELEKVGDTGEQGTLPPLALLPLPVTVLRLLPLLLVVLSLLLLLPVGEEVAALSERNCSWLAARTSWTLAAQSSRSYSLCSSSLNVNG